MITKCWQEKAINCNLDSTNLKAGLKSKEPVIGKVKEQIESKLGITFVKLVKKYRIDMLTDIFIFGCQQHPNWVISSAIKLISLFYSTYSLPPGNRISN